VPVSSYPSVAHQRPPLGCIALGFPLTHHTPLREHSSLIGARCFPAPLDSIGQRCQNHPNWAPADGDNGIRSCQPRLRSGAMLPRTYSSIHWVVTSSLFWERGGKPFARLSWLAPGSRFFIIPPLFVWAEFFLLHYTPPCLPLYYCTKKNLCDLFFIPGGS